MMKNKKHASPNRKKRILIIFSIVLVILFLVIPFGLAVFIYEGNFGERFETYEPMSRSLSEFSGLKAKKHRFLSDKGQMLTGYTYYRDTKDSKGIVIIAHGLGGGGHNTYIDVADYLSSNGYIAFAYDATGNDESEGESIKGLPQGIIDLEYAINYIKETEELKELPIMLFGHSWGAYSAMNVLNVIPDIKAVVSVAGFNSSMDIIEAEGKKIMGDTMSLLLPYLSVYEKLKFGQYSSNNAIDGVEHSSAKLMLIHSQDDEMISPENSFDIFYNLYGTNPNFEFVKYENRGHNYIYYSDNARKYIEEFNMKFDEYLASLDEEFTPKIKSDYLKENLDKKLLYDFDKELMNKIIMFYDNSIK